MGRKNIIYNHRSIVEGDMSLVEVVGDSTNCAQHDTLTYTALWTGGALTNGKIVIEASLDGETWTELDFADTIQVDGAADYLRAIINEIGFSYVRPKYVRINPAATGIVNVTVFASNRGA